MLTVGSLFSGIGGLDLGLERAGMQIRWQVESDPYATRVLRKHWPDASHFSDVRDVGRDVLAPVDLICGGFPCQDLSHAASGRDRPGLSGDRSGLWSAFRDIIQDVGPGWAVVENVYHAWRRWVPRVRQDLWALGYASVPLRVSAEDVGAPFQGHRVFVIAKAYSIGEPSCTLDAEAPELPEFAGSRWPHWGEPSPRALGVADGVPDRMERLAACGNAVVPAVAEYVGRLITSWNSPSNG